MIKILAIGNSFSEDALAYLWDLGHKNNIEFIIGNLFIGGCDLKTHVYYLNHQDKAYAYYKNTSGHYICEAQSLLYGLNDEIWDIITIQQASHYSGKPETYKPHLHTLLKYIKENQPQAHINFHQTWAYQQDSQHPNFKDYNQDQMFMYKAIKNAVKEEVIKYIPLKSIINVGLFIQICRAYGFGDQLTRDGFHLSYDVGRYLASLVWLVQLTGINSININHLDIVNHQDIKIINKCFKIFNEGNHSL